MFNSTADNTTCMFRNSEPNVVTFVGDTVITNELTEFNAGTILVSVSAHVLYLKFSRPPPSPLTHTNPCSVVVYIRLTHGQCWAIAKL